MSRAKWLLLIIGLAVGGLFIFHIVHHLLYCRYRTVPGKSHCAECGHREICQKTHHRNVL